ncbi:hypothetical protein DSO57_1038769 [Entomophthora muscae]|uniref:Uncharacterized protein n=1 Tax=Entomophthora muscae TaxID=34485 RepID=A0ACC2TWQ9_9FUNG|nr:hypothetical protein DSO57_1038769 [Entomophthora muscae]
MQSHPFFQGYTPSSLSLLALQNNPQLPSVEKVTAKRSFDADGSDYSYHTTYPFISHKKPKFDAVLEKPKHGHPRPSAQNKTANPLSQIALPAQPPIRIAWPSPVEEATIIKSTPLKDLNRCHQEDTICEAIVNTNIVYHVPNTT